MTAQKLPEPPILNIPPVTQWIALITVGIFLVQYFGPLSLDYWLMTHFGFVPAQWGGIESFTIWSALSVVGHVFLHGSWIHLGMNVMMLIAFGAGLERMINAKQMLTIYFSGGVAGALVHFLLSSTSVAVLIGASGAISALFGAILVVLHRGGGLGQTKSLTPFIILWVGISILIGVIGGPGGMQNIAWAAHLGGFFAGIGYARFLFRS